MAEAVTPRDDGEDVEGEDHENLMIKCGLVGDMQVGKTTLMVKYVENRLDEDYIQTLGVNFMEKSIMLRNTEVTFSIWDLGGQREFLSMLPLVCNDASAVFFMFDLSRKSTLVSIKEWYRQARGLNRKAVAFLVGTKYDVFITLPQDQQEEIDKQVPVDAWTASRPTTLRTMAHQVCSAGASGEEVCQSHEGSFGLHIRDSLHQCPETLQSRSRQGLRPALHTGQDHQYRGASSHFLKKTSRSNLGCLVPDNGARCLPGAGRTTTTCLEASAQRREVLGKV